MVNREIKGEKVELVSIEGIRRPEGFIVEKLHDIPLAPFGSLISLTFELQGRPPGGFREGSTQPHSLERRREGRGNGGGARRPGTGARNPGKHSTHFI